MATVKEYVKYYKDYSFEETPFNDIDSLVFSILVYGDFDKIIPAEKGKYILFSDAIRLYLKKQDEKKKYPRFIREVNHLIDWLKDSKRYANIKMYYYIKMVDDEKQFCAFTLRFSGMTYVAFEGTDTSIIGWKEDFLLSSMFPVPAQRFAIEYLNRTIGLFDSNIYVGGHSKGGNLALISSMFASVRIRIKIKAIYNFDGPGLRKKEFQSVNFRRMQSKIKMFVPEDSTIGMLLLHPSNYKVVKSGGIGLWQHDAFTWELFGSVFVLGNLTERSLNFEKSNVEFISSLDNDDRNKIIEIIFSVFEKLGIKDISQIRIPKLNQAISLVKDIKNIDSELRKKIITLIKILIKGM